MMGKLKACTIMNDTVVWDITGNRDNRDCIDIDLFTLYEMECISEKEGLYATVKRRPLHYR